MNGTIRPATIRKRKREKKCVYMCVYTVDFGENKGENLKSVLIWMFIFILQ